MKTTLTVFLVPNMCWVFTLLFLWMAVHGSLDAASYTNYLMTAPIEDNLEESRPLRPGEKAQETAEASNVYEIAIWAPKDTSESKEPYVRFKFTKDGVLRRDETKKVSELEPINLDDGIRLFSDIPGGGWAYLYLENPPRIKLNNSDLAYLPEVPGKTVIAPVVVSGGTVEFLKSYIYHNYHSTKSGGVYATGGAQVRVSGGQIAYNKAEVGAVVVDGTSVVELDEVQVLENEGSIAGAIYTSEQATFSGRKVRFENQTMGSFATGVFSSEQSKTTIVDCQFEGRPISEGYKSCLLDPAVTDVYSCGNRRDFKGPLLHADDTAVLTIISSVFTQHSTVHGTILTSGLSELNVRDTRFIGNVAQIGAGVFIRSRRGSAATLSKCEFHDNVARFGGAMVLGGNGNFTIDQCTFTQNRAILGGAVWGNKTQNVTGNTEGFGKPSSVARVTVILSDFANNTAISHGGALFVKRADIESNLSTFYNNTAGGSGGAIYTDDGYNLQLLGSQFDSNSANVSGGAVFAVNANVINSINTTFTGHSAFENGGAIASVDGAGVFLRNTIINSGHVDGSGGAIYTDNVETIDLSISELVGNTAGESGGALSLGKSSHLELDSLVLSPNVAFGKGGAIHASEGKSAIIKNIDISAVNSSSAVISLDSMGTVELSGFHFEGNKDKTQCGGLEIDGASSLTITGMNFVSNEVRQHGGALCLAGIDSGEFSNLTFSDNKANIAGGAIYIRNSNELNFRDVKFNQNFAIHQGGAIRGVNVTSLNLIGDVFILNSVTWKGAAVYLEGSSINIQSSNFTHNYAGTNFEVFKSKTTVTNSPQSESASGVIYVRDGGTFQSQDSLYEFNQAEADGGMLAFVGMQNVHIQYDHYLNGSASKSGGCILASGVLNLSIWDTTLKYCEAASGGALMVEGHSNVKGGYLVVEDNKAQNGGALCLTGINAGELLDLEFADNKAGVNGGAIYITNSGVLNFRNIKIDTSSAGNQGGAIYTENSSNLDFLDCQFDSNSAHGSGGAVFASNTHTIYSTNTTFTNHSALENGGTIASVDGAGIVLRNSAISNSHAKGSGGGIYTDNVENIDLYKSDIVKNEAGESGGALSLEKSSHLGLDSMVLSSNVAYGKGGAIHASEGKSAIIKNIDISAVNSSSAVISLASMGTVELSGFNTKGYKGKPQCGGLEIDGAASLTITGMKFVGNEVQEHGGALCLAGIDSGVLSDLEFTDNKAGLSGGAIHIANSNNLSFKDCRFNRNSANQHGGAIRGVNVMLLNLFGDFFTLNTATSNGGAVYLEEGSSINIEKSNFIYNYAGTNFEAFKNKTSVSNSPQNESASGIVYVRDGGSFQSQNSIYENNEADATGGMLALIGMQKAVIQHDHYHNGSASTTGGCIFARDVVKLSIWDTTLQSCEAASGGALMVEGHSNVEGRHLLIEDNKAQNGGAFLCLGESLMNIEATNFSFNSAEEGCTASVECRCNINFKSSVFYRDEDLFNNGEFFHTVEGCGEINAEDCEFYGGEYQEKKEHKGKDDGSSIPWLWIIISAVSLIGIILILIIFLRRRKDDKKKKEDLEAGTKANLIGETKSSEDSSSSEESEEDSAGERDSDDSNHRPLKSTKKTPKNPVTKVILLEGPTSVEKKTHAKQEAVSHRQKASIDKINDGAGPSNYHTSVMPPDLEPVTSESEQGKED